MNESIRRILERNKPPVAKQAAAEEPQPATPAKPSAHHRYLADDDEHEKYHSIGLAGTLAATEKLLAINRGLADTDDRDALYNDRIFTGPRLIAERVKLDDGRTLRSMMGRVARAKNLRPLGPAAFDNYTVGYLKSNPLAPALEEINALDIAEQPRRITKMGPGGIGDPQAITTSMQSIHSSQFGFISPLEGPECFSDLIEVYTERGWVFWSDVADDDVFACRVDGRLEWHPASRIVRAPNSGYLVIAESDSARMCVTPTHRVVWKASADSDVEEITPASMVLGHDIYLPSLVGPPKHIAANQWQLQEFNGIVYCATVPGGQLLVRGNSLNTGYWSGNSERAGIDVRLAYGARIGSDGRIYQLMENRRTGKKEWVSPTMLKGKTLKLPD